MESKSARGGKRPGSGRVRKNLRLDVGTSIRLKQLAAQYGQTQEQLIAAWVDAEWKRSLEVEAAVRAEVLDRLKSK